MKCGSYNEIQIIGKSIFHFLLTIRDLFNTINILLNSSIEADHIPNLSTFTIEHQFPCIVSNLTATQRLKFERFRS